MRVYHRTAATETILRDGFEDRGGYYLTGSLHSGVWLSNMPLDASEGAKGFTVLVLNIPVAVLRPYEWVEDGTPYREFLVPAAIVNRYGPASIHDDDWKGCTRDQILTYVQWCKRDPGDDVSAQILAHLPSLERHGLLAKAPRVSSENRHSSRRARNTRPR